MWKKLEPYKSSIILLFALFIGAVFGVIAPDLAIKLKPIGSIFLNLLFMIIVPLVGISVMSSIAKMTDLNKLGKVLILVLIISIVMAILPALGIIGLAQIFDPSQGVVIDLTKEFTADNKGMDFVSMFTTDDFSGLLSKSNILALIVMSIIAGIAIGQSGEKGQTIAHLLDCANEVVMKIVSIIMKAAPIGLGAFFAATMASQNTALLHSFGGAIGLFFVASIAYFIVGSTLYSYIAGGKKAVSAFWSNSIAPIATSLGTSSSLGSLPVTIQAAKKMALKEELVDICLPLFVNLNKGGAAMTAALKVVFICAILGIPFTFDMFLMTVVIAVLSAIIVGGVPGGAFLGDIFIVTTLGLPLEAIPMLIVIGATTDAPATMLNVVNDLNATQLVQKFMGDKGKEFQSAVIETAKVV